MTEDTTPVADTGEKLAVLLKGALDAAHGMAIRAQLDPLLNEPQTVSLSGEQVERVDAAGLQVLVAFVLARKQRRRAVEWTNASASLRQGAALLGLSEVMGLK